MNNQSVETLQRFEVLKAFRLLAQLANDPKFYYCGWVYEVPDEATDEDLMDIAGDEDEFASVVDMFIECFERYVPGCGFYVGGRLYGGPVRDTAEGEEENE